MGFKSLCFQRKSKADWSVVWKILQIIKSHDINIIHTHGYLASIYGMIAACCAPKKIPIIITLHQRAAKHVSWRMNIYVNLMLALARLCKAHFIAVSQDVKDSVLSRKDIRKDMITIIYNGIQCEEGEEISSCDKTKMGLDPQKKTIGIVGRLVHGKGHLFFVKLAQALYAQRTDLEFVIIGDGPLKNEIEQYIMDQGMAGKISMLGFRQDIIDLIYCLDIMTLCSDHEGIPYVVLEAMKCRTPVVSTSVGGLPEIITSGYNGILTPHGDVEMMKTSILELIDNPSLMKSIHEHGYGTLLDRFSTRKMARETIALYQSLL